MLCIGVFSPASCLADCIAVLTTTTTNVLHTYRGHLDPSPVNAPCTPVPWSESVPYVGDGSDLGHAIGIVLQTNATTHIDPTYHTQRPLVSINNLWNKMQPQSYFNLSHQSCNHKQWYRNRTPNVSTMNN